MLTLALLVPRGHSSSLAASAFARSRATVRVSVLGARGVAAMFAHGVASRGVSAGGCDAPNGVWIWSQRCVEA